jgi:3-methyladenine DNA glycosylase AlkD
MTSLEKIKRELKSHTNKPQAAILRRFFKTEPGQYGAGDIFLGVKVPLQRRIALKYRDLGLAGVKELLASPIHEFRLVGLLILIEQYAAAKPEKIKKTIVNFYLRNTKAINNWDLVDLSVYKILGDWLLSHNRTILFKLAKSKNLWERRMAMIATFAFIKVGETKETFLIAKKLLRDEHDLIHKAVGWMLREAGKRVSEPALLKFLDEHAGQMPRTALRYAIERLEPRRRERYRVK